VILYNRKTSNPSARVHHILCCDELLVIVARSTCIAIIIMIAIHLALNIAPPATAEVFPARAWIEGRIATVGFVIGCLNSKGIGAIVRYIVGTGSALSDRCRKRNAGREGDESKS